VLGEREEFVSSRKKEISRSDLNLFMSEVEQGIDYGDAFLSYVANTMKERIFGSNPVQRQFRGKPIADFK
jgi:hypothetical protein